MMKMIDGHQNFQQSCHEESIGFIGIKDKEKTHLLLTKIETLVQEKRGFTLVNL